MRLRPEYAYLYPNLVAGEWHPASDIGARMLLWQLNSGRPPNLGERLLTDRHFEFRGGTGRGPQTPLRTRASDPQDIELPQV
ncbi:MAG: hypothetical protein ACRENB_04040 [Gemmatimonadales bacterium]